MRSPRLLAAVLIAALTQTACASSRPLVTAQPRPLPAEYSVPCPPPPEPASNSADDVALTLKAMYDAYGICAGRVIDLVDWTNRH